MKTQPPHLHLSRRERQIMDLLYARGRMTAAEIQQSLPDPPGYSAVRAMMATLERKGHVRHEAEGVRYVYAPAASKDRAMKPALRHMLRTFFGDSPEKAVAALLDVSAGKLSREELDRIAEMIDRARKEGR